MTLSKNRPRLKMNSGERSRQETGWSRVLELPCGFRHVDVVEDFPELHVQHHWHFHDPRNLGCCLYAAEVPAFIVDKSDSSLEAMQGMGFHVFSRQRRDFMKFQFACCKSAMKCICVLSFFEAISHIHGENVGGGLCSSCQIQKSIFVRTTLFNENVHVANCNNQSVISLSPPDLFSN